MTDRTWDVIIVGAGSVGTPLAWQLAEAGLRPLVVDRFASVGQGSNKAAIGGIRATHSDPAKIRVSLESLRLFSNWQAAYGDDIGWRQGGYAFVAYRDMEAQTYKNLLVTQKKYGLNIDWYDAPALLKIIPALNPEGLLGGTFSPGDGSASPMLSALAFEQRAQARGAAFHYGETVLAITQAGGRVTGLRTNRGEYATPLVVNAAGPWASEVAALVDVDLPVAPDSHEAGITEPVAPFLGPMVVDTRPSADSANYYFYQHYTGQVVFCITPSPLVSGVDRRETSVFLPQVTRRMLGIMPCLANLKVRRTWRGMYPMTPDGAPIVGPVKGLDGYLNAAGMCGQGYMLGPGLAVALRQYVTGALDDDMRAALDLWSPHRSFAGKEALK